MPHSIIHQASSETSWRILSLLRLGERRIRFLKQALGMTESAFSHALDRLEERRLVETRRVSREKIARLTIKGRTVLSSLQALCFALEGSDGAFVDDDAELMRLLRDGVAPHA